MIILEKKQWKKIQADILKNSGNDTIYLLISIDIQEAAIALVTGTHVKILPNSTLVRVEKGSKAPGG